MQATSVNTDALLNENIIDLRYYWKVVMKNKWWIIALALLAAALAVLVASKIKPVYRSTSTVLIESSDNKVVSIENVYGMNTHAKEYFLTQYELLKSRELVAMLVDKLKLVEHPEFDPRQEEKIDWRGMIPDQLETVNNWLPPVVDPDTLSDAALRSMVLAKVQESLNVEMVTNTQLVKINFDAHDPKLASLAANTLADLYIERNMESRLEMTQKAAGWLTGRLEGLGEKLKESEARLQAYREKETLVEISGVHTLNAKELSELTQRYVAASDERSKAQSILEQVRVADGMGDLDRLLELPAILSHDLVKSLKTEQVQADLKVAELSKHYGQRHPRMISARAEADQARAELYKQVMWVARGIEADYRNALETEKAVSAQLKMAKRDAQSVNRKEFKLSELEREVETNRQLYDMFLTRAKETGETGGLQPAHARIVDPATPASLPVSPNTKLILALAIMLGLSAGVILAFVRDALDTTIKTPEELENKLHLPLLGTLPKTRTRGRDEPYEGFLSARFSSFAESVRSLRSSLIVANMEKPYKSMLITSTLPDEGKSTVALNLAEALGQMERVLLIEADLRKPSLHKTLEVPDNTPGLSNLLSQSADLNSCIRKMPHLGIDVMVAGTQACDPQELLSIKRFYPLLQVLELHYDRIIIDTPPTLPVSDAIVLSKFVDAILYVVKAGSTPATVAAKCIKRLKNADAPLLGAVLNRFDFRYSEYGSYYGKYYSYSDNSLIARSESRPAAIPSAPAA